MTAIGNLRVDQLRSTISAPYSYDSNEQGQSGPTSINYLYFLQLWQQWTRSEWTKFSLLSLLPTAMTAINNVRVDQLRSTISAPYSCDSNEQGQSGPASVYQPFSQMPMTVSKRWECRVPNSPPPPLPPPPNDLICQGIDCISESFGEWMSGQKQRSQDLENIFESLWIETKDRS